MQRVNQCDLMLCVADAHEAHAAKIRAMQSLRKALPIGALVFVNGHLPVTIARYIADEFLMILVRTDDTIAARNSGLLTDSDGTAAIRLDSICPVPIGEMQ